MEFTLSDTTKLKFTKVKKTYDGNKLYKNEGLSILGRNETE